MRMEVIPIGKVTSDLLVFDTLDSTEDITFTLRNRKEAVDESQKEDKSHH